jgi:hypothetical protein
MTKRETTTTREEEDEEKREERREEVVVNAVETTEAHYLYGILHMLADWTQKKPGPAQGDQSRH